MIDVRPLPPSADTAAPQFPHDAVALFVKLGLIYRFGVPDLTSPPAPGGIWCGPSSRSNGSTPGC